MRTIAPALALALGLAGPAHAWYLTPRLGISTAVQEVHDDWQVAAVPFSLGFSVQPSGPRLVAPFVSPQLDIEAPTAGEGASYAPTLRVGLLLRDEAPEYSSAVFSWFQVYALAGWRLPGGAQPAGSRIGIGVSSPVGLVVSLRALEAGVPIPNTFEFVVDGIEHDPVGVFRFGITL